jgi:1-acyl-sn-glycerol-3-phosphate acyltransferase
MAARADTPTVAFQLLAALSRPLVRSLFRLQVMGEQHLPTGGFVLCANHLSGLDAWALSHPLFPRHPRYMAKAELFRSPFRRLLAALGLFPVQRGSSREAIVTAVRHAAAGRIVVIFPEGSRGRRAQSEGPHTGAARVALAAGVPLVPAAVGGTDRARSLQRWRVSFGPPISLDDLRDEHPRHAAREGTRRLWERVLELQEAVA